MFSIVLLSNPLSVLDIRPRNQSLLINERNA
jgi:hypothetical protein